MIFISMCSDIKAGIIERNRGKSYGFEVTEAMAGGEAIKGDLYVEDGLIKWGNRNGFGSKGLDVIAKEGKSVFSERRVGKAVESISLEEVKDTDENPIIFVLCSEIKLIRGIPSEVKLLRLDDTHVLAALITGACVFNGVPLQRCDKSVNVENAGLYYTFDYGSIFYTDPFLGKDANSRYDYSWDVLMECYLRVGIEGEFSCRTVRSREYVFDDSKYKESREQYEKFLEEQKQKREAEKARRIEENRIFREQQERKQKEKEEAEAAKKVSKGRSRSTKAKVESKSVGASDFLKMVASLNK